MNSPLHTFLLHAHPLEAMDSCHPMLPSLSPYTLLFCALFSIPISHYILALFLGFLIFLYNFLEFHFLEDVFSGLRGCAVTLTFNSRSQIYEGVVSKCRILHGRYLATPWLSSPHFQTLFLNFFGRPPVVNYRRQIFHASDGGNIALDWLLRSDAPTGDFHVNNAISKDDTTPIVVVIPGLTSDSTSAYIKHFAFNIVKRGWNIVVSNHRGLGGISVTSDCFYNAGWTEDMREVIDYLRHEYPVAPLFAVGTSIGANILVKYLGEDGENVPVAGAAAICNPWDLLIGDRFISRRLLQKFYDMALVSGLQGYAQLHQPRLSRLADWEGIKKSRSIRDFDTYATCLVGKFETVDTFYRRCSSASFVGKVAVPLLCVSALDDPVCTREAIPWDECRANKNVVLATPQHGGHLAFFEGIAATSLWWVRAVDEYLSVLHSSPFMHKEKKIQNCSPHSSLESAIDQGPYVNFAEDGMVAAMGNEQTRTVVGPFSGRQNIHDKSNDDDMGSESEQDDPVTTENSALLSNVAQTSKLAAKSSALRKRLEELSLHNRISMWLMAFIAINTSWPLIGSVLYFLFKKKFRSIAPAALHGR